jgi:hypothetical protein
MRSKSDQTQTNDYQINGMWRGPLGVFESVAFKGSSVAGAVNKDHSSDPPIQFPAEIMRNQVTTVDLT